MEKNEIYQLLSDKLSVAPSWLPEGDRFIKILETLYAPEEAELALSVPFMPASLEDISNASGIEPERAEKILKSMARKGLVYAFTIKGDPKFLLFSLDTIFNYPIKYKHSDINQDTLRSLWKEYYEEGWEYPEETFLPPGRVLPVEEAIHPQSAALPFDLVNKHIDEAKYLSVGNCSCRSIVGACDNPLETCIGVGYAAKYLVEQGLSRPIDKEEAKKIVREAHDAGLVSISTNMKNNIGIICHCCKCCCFQIGIAVKHNLYQYRPVGSFVASVDSDRCTACGTCIDRCPMNAISIDNYAYSDPEKCIGCGLCVESCPEEALSLILRDPPPEIPNDLMEYTMKAVAGQGTTEEFLKELKIKKKE